MILTKQQRKALKRVFDRQPLYVTVDGTISGWAHWPRASYRQFRRTVKAAAGCVMVEWCGMWLGIEPDGHTHS